uniref:MOSC domain-containing protein n=1 Tax=Moniliophthora roreri TaxID=221103 RepID=A0A0W0G8A3_MONRR
MLVEWNTAINTLLIGLPLVVIAFLYSKVSSDGKTRTRSFGPIVKPDLRGANERDKGARIIQAHSGNITSNQNFGYGEVRVSKILVHPIKSCRGTPVQTSRYTPEGLEFDRKWGIIEAETHVMITAREFPKASNSSLLRVQLCHSHANAQMVLITPTIQQDENSTYGGLLHVTFPEDSNCRPFSIPLRPDEAVLKTWESLNNLSMFGVFTVDGYICQAAPESSSSPELNLPSNTLSAYFGRPVHLVYKGSTPRACIPSTNFPKLDATAVYQDLYPLLLFSEENVLEIEKELRPRVGTQGIDERWKADKVAIERFRPNIVLKGAGAFAEDGWEEITIGPDPATPRILVVGKCTRCLLPNVSPETGEKDKAVPFKVIMKFRMGVDSNHKNKACVGSWGVPLQDGVVTVGDEVSIKKVLAS